MFHDLQGILVAVYPRRSHKHLRVSTLPLLTLNFIVIHPFIIIHRHHSFLIATPSQSRLLPHSHHQYNQMIIFDTSPSGSLQRQSQQYNQITQLFPIVCMIATSRRPNFAIDCQSLLLQQLREMKNKHSKPKSLRKRSSDPVNTQIYIHLDNFDDFTTLPPIKQIITPERQRNKTQQKPQQRTDRQPIIGDLKSRRCETITYDLECTNKFPTENTGRKVLAHTQNAKGRKFVQIDMLVLQTCYAKNMNHQLIEKVGGVDTSNKQISNLPTKESIPDFIKNYKVKNQKLNVDDLVRSPHFAVQFVDKVSLYFGDVKEGQLEGKGIMINKNWIFQGLWSNSQKYQGVQITAKGTYKGRYLRNERSKVGQFFWANGQYYSGQWCKSKKHGTGLWKSQHGDVYMGHWNKGKVQGYGIHLTKTGQKYEGYFHNFLKEGQGKQYFPNGDYFQGSFRQGRPQGFGIYKWKNGITYEGQFNQGFRQGKGKIKKQDMEYEGSFSREKAHGQGRLMVWNGDNYMGQFRRGKKQGKGISKQKRCVFVGMWQNNRFVQKLN